MASSSADCVFGGVRLISSASSTLAKIGPGTKVQVRRPVVGSSSMMSVPVMSDGIRSGVNWMRLNSRPSACASVRTSSVLAVPGKPVIRQWPPTNSATITCSITSSCPTITLRTWEMMASCAFWKRSIRCCKPAASLSCAGVDIRLFYSFPLSSNKSFCAGLKLGAASRAEITSSRA